MNERDTEVLEDLRCALRDAWYDCDEGPTEELIYIMIDLIDKKLKENK